MSRKKLKLKVEKAKPAPNQIIPVCIYMTAKLHRFLKATAAQRGLSLSEYVNARIHSAGEIVLTGDFIRAPDAVPAPVSTEPQK